MEKGSTILRGMLEKNELIFAPGVYDVMTAMIAHRAGFNALYMTGSGTSMFTLGLPDIGLISLNEMVDNAARIASRVNVPLISDADTGFGNALGVMRTIGEFIQRGIAAIHIEDQVSPKRCGHLAGKLCISADEMSGKIRAAADVRNKLDPDFIIIARSDFRGTPGGSLEGTIERLNEYMNAGADVAFADGLVTVEELKTLCQQVHAPIMYNMGGISPYLTKEQLKEIGVNIVIAPESSVLPSFFAVKDFMEKLSRDILYEQEFIKEKGIDWSDVFTFAGIPEAQRDEEKYLPQEQVHLRYGQESVGMFGKGNKESGK